jgi:hypothetical protein
MTADDRPASEDAYRRAFDALSLTGDATPDAIRAAYERARAEASPEQQADLDAAHELLSRPQRALHTLLAGSGVPVPRVVPPPPAGTEGLPLEVMRALVGRSSPFSSEPPGDG